MFRPHMFAGPAARRWAARVFCSAVLTTLLLGTTVHRAAAQSFGLDDLPAGPITGAPIGPIPGLGAEDPYGLVGPPLAPSPSLGVLGPMGDGAWLSPGPVIQHPGPNGWYIDAFSTHHADPGTDIALDFSVDRVTIGAAGSGVGAQAGLGQAHGDIFQSTQAYISPGAFAGTLGPGPFAGILPTFAGGPPSNVLLTDESVFGLLTPAGVVGPGVAVPLPIASPALHDNLDSFDNLIFDGNGDGMFDIDGYFTLYPDEAVAVGTSPADIFAVAAGDGGALAVPYAPVPLMGLDPFQDSIDALVVYDHNLKPVPLLSPGAPGAIEPVIDYALFSLAPGSVSLQLFGLDAADVLFTDFTGAFAVYAQTQSLGLIPSVPGIPFAGDSVDALDAVTLPSANQLTIRDGLCQYNLSGLVGQRLGSAAGLANLITGLNNHMTQNWFWYRGSGDTREYALSNQILFTSSSVNSARLVYNEPLADGTVPNALIFDLEYTISDLSTVPNGAAPPACVRCEIVIAIKVRNLTNNTVTVDFFSYNDMDLNGSAGNDSAVIAGVDNQIQLVRDPGPGGTNCVASGVYKVSSTDHVAWEIDAFANIRNKLTDAVADVLLNAVSPFGPGDYTGAQQWKITLGPAGAVGAAPFDEWVGSVVKEVIIHLPGDADGDCAVNLTDLAIVLSRFGAACSP